MAAVDIVQRQLEAYNARDLESFLSTYSETIRVFRPPSPEPSLSGKAQLSQFYATQRFNRAGLKAEIVNRMLLGNRVIDHERIWGIGDGPVEVAVVYEVEGEYIQNMWLFAAR